MNTYQPTETLFLCGDQLTAERFRSQQAERSNGSPEESWERLRFGSLDFHLIMNLADVRVSVSLVLLFGLFCFVLFFCFSFLITKNNFGN